MENPPGNVYGKPMPRPRKGLTSKFPLAMTPEERAIVERVQLAHAQSDIRITLNDAIRILIRRAATPLPDSVDQARDRVTAHWTACDACTGMTPGCADGWWLQDVYHHTLTLARTPPPPTPPARRTVSGRPPLLPPPPGKQAP